MTHGDIINGPDRTQFFDEFSAKSSIRLEVQNPVDETVEIVFCKINRLTIQDDDQAVWIEGFRSDNLLGVRGRYNYLSKKGFVFFGDC